MLAIINGRVIVGDSIEDKAILLEGERILDVCPKVPDKAEVIDAKGRYVSPGFIDIHIHGCKGFDIMEDTYEAVMTMSQYLLKTGVAGFLGATMTESIPKIREAIKEAKRASYAAAGADLLGIHMEGPFISGKYKGAQGERYILEPSIKDFKEICGDDEDFVKLVTLSPELAGAEELIRYLDGKGIIPSMGHTGASYEEAKAGIEWGIKSSTHTFNGMKGFDHREPGASGAVLDSDIAAECIADGVHVHGGALRILARQKGPDKIILVTDCMMAGGMADGEYALGGQKVYVKDGIARLEEGQLAGSTLSMDRAVRNILSILDISVPKAVLMATRNPAMLLGLKDRGRIEKGCMADLVIFDENINIDMVLKSGKRVDV